MTLREMLQAQNRLAQARTRPDFVTYGVNLANDPKDRYRVSLFGLCETGEIFVEITDGHDTCAGYFRSRHKNCPPEQRRASLTLVDTADAYELARTINRFWRRFRPKPPGSLTE